MPRARSLSRLGRRARRLRFEALVLYRAARHPGTPWYAKALIGAVAAYALSPIDLVPDFIPVVGYLDDLIVIPLGIAISVRLIPPQVLAECRLWAEEALGRLTPVSRALRILAILFWLGLVGVVVLLILRWRH